MDDIKLGPATNLTLLRNVSMSITEIVIGSMTTHANLHYTIEDYRKLHDIKKSSDFYVLLYARRNRIDFLLQMVAIQPTYKHKEPNRHYLGQYGSTHLISDYREDTTKPCNSTKLQRNELAIVCRHDFDILCG